MSEQSKTHVVFIYHKTGQVIVRQASLMALIFGLWSIGHYADSAALEWAGVILGLIAVLGIARMYIVDRENDRMTPAQAREWLRREFGE